LDEVGVVACQADPLYTINRLLVVLKYNAPVSKESPSLSADGSEDFCPRYLSSKLSKLVAALVAEVAAADAEVAASLALVVAVSL